MLDKLLKISKVPKDEVNIDLTFKKFKKRFIQEYASEVSKYMLRKHVLNRGNYIWHLFSFELIDSNLYLSGEKAKEAYNQRDKSNAIVFLEIPTNTFIKFTDEYSNSNNIDGCGEIYVFAEDMSWIYINTHEESIGIGPYFIKNNKK